MMCEIKEKNWKHLRSTSTFITATSDVPTELVAVQVYNPDFSRCMCGIKYEGLWWRIVLGPSVLVHFHVISVFGLAEVTVHTNVAKYPSITLYGLLVMDMTSGLSDKKNIMFCFTLMLSFICSFCVWVDNSVSGEEPVSLLFAWDVIWMIFLYFLFFQFSLRASFLTKGSVLLSQMDRIFRRNKFNFFLYELSCIVSCDNSIFTTNSKSFKCFIY